jgi:3-isopropylmalate dehydratase small subunit
VISTEIADIFRNNSLKNGLLPVIVDEATHQWLLANPGAEVEIDLETTTLTLPDGVSGEVPDRGLPALLPAQRRRRARLPALEGRAIAATSVARA